jgi:hypothetical protein
MIEGLNPNGLYFLIGIVCTVVFFTIVLAVEKLHNRKKK